MQRWGEEVQLLQEEMRRALAFFDYQAALWDSRATLRTDDQFLDLRDGVRAYAAKQASINRKRRIKFADAWATPSMVNNLDPDSDAEDDGAGVNGADDE
jgi:hypothetical protein